MKWFWQDARGVKADVERHRANIVEYTAMDEQSRLIWVRKFLEVS